MLDVKSIVHNSKYNQTMPNGSKLYFKILAELGIFCWNVRRRQRHFPKENPWKLKKQRDEPCSAYFLERNNSH